MNVHETTAGTPVLDMTEPEFHAFLEGEVHASLGLSIDEFTTRVQAGEVDWGDPDVFYVAGILGFGQNGHHVEP